MNKTLEHFTTLVRKSVRKSAVELDAPRRPEGNWWIDVCVGKKRVTLEYRPQRGFGIFHDDAGYGEGPAELYRTPELAARRIRQLLTGSKSKRRRLSVKELRELYQFPQAELAQKVGVKQSAISRFEQRSEVKLGTLAAVVEALGGELEVRAHFSDANIPISVKH